MIPVLIVFGLLGGYGAFTLLGDVLEWLDNRRWRKRHDQR